MRITTIGGGPGGLYAAILLARAGHDVTVYERNAPDDTFGFGVVFSAATLAELEHADAPSYDTLMRACARWDPIDVHHRGEVIRARGNRFAAIARRRLLGLLRERAAAVGAKLLYSTEVDEVDEHLDADLVIGADGIHSGVRERFADAFGPRITTEGGKYIWLATTKRLEAFTFVFRETEHGWFQVHAYPYDEGHATWIVECDETVWREAGLDRREGVPLPPGASDERSIAELGELFADVLDGHPLLGTGSRWLDWRTVRATRWRHRNVVLLGDACHTAHFSIGSGTKLAMEDAIALARALEREAGIDEALAAYESDRKPVVDRWQDAAITSMQWFGRYPSRYAQFRPPQFVYSLLTRSGRIDYDGARIRDPQLIGALERWLSPPGGGGRDGSPPAVAPPPAANRFDLAGRTLRNRLVLVPAPDFGAADGVPSEARQRALARLARGGAGLALVDLVAVRPDGRATPGCAGLWDDGHVDWVDGFCAAAHESGALAGVQLVHAGARGSTRPRDRGSDRPLPPGRAWPLVAASPVPYTPRSQTPAALDEDGMAGIVDAFTAAARRADEAGVDVLEVHAGHGYLLGGFCSPLTNERDDAYGGDLDGRLRFPLAVLAAVRAAWPADKVLSVTLSASDLAPGGTSEDEAVETARRFAAAGVDVFTAVAGQTTRAVRPGRGRTLGGRTPHAGPGGVGGRTPHAGYDGPFGAEWSDLVRNRAQVPTIAVGGIPTPSVANHVLAAGKADLCVAGRPSQPDPDWLHHDEE